jgi:hypothetical protein
MKRLIPLILIPIALGGLYLTNPSKSDFQQFIERAMEEHAEAIPDEYRATMDDMGLNFTGIAALISRLSTRDDYFLFSIHELAYADQKFKFLGIGTFFLPLQEPQALSN